MDPVVDPLNDAVGYNPTTNTYTVYSEDFSLLGIHPYTVTATLTQYTSVTMTLTANIELVDPCLDPENVESVI